MWNAVWDDWFMIKSGWLGLAVFAGILVGTFIAEQRHERKNRRHATKKAESRNG